MNRKSWLSLMAKSESSFLSSLWTDLGIHADYTIIRPAEIGLVMVKAKQGNTGDQFNLAELSVSRCSVELKSGQIGHGYHQGRSKRAAFIVAICDALAQTPTYNIIHSNIFKPLQKKQKASHEKLARKSTSTKVEFFTLERGEV